MNTVKRAVFTIVAICAFNGVAPAPANDQTSHAAVFQQIWTTVRDDFFDAELNGVDWPAVKQRFAPRVAAADSRAQFAALVNEMLAELHTSHTHYYTQDDPCYYQLLGVFEQSDAYTAPLNQIRQTLPHHQIGYVGIGIVTQRQDAGTFVSAVFDGGPADQAGILVGDRLVSVDGEPFHAIRSFAGKEDQPVTVVAQRQADTAGKVVSVTPRFFRAADMFVDAMRSSVRMIPAGKAKIGYIHVWSYSGEKYQQLLEHELFEGNLRAADALLLDLREGWGGASAAYLNLFNQRIPCVEMTPRDGHTVQLDRQWRKPVALLINGEVRSGKEVFAHGFKRNAMGPIVGTPTAGAVVGGALRFLPDHSVLYLAMGDVRVDGQRLEGHGVAPTIQVRRPIPFCAGRDPQLETAVRELTRILAEDR